MLKLEDLKPGAQIQGLVPNEVVRVVQAEPIGDQALTLYYKGANGQIQEQMLFRSDEPRLALATTGRACAFDADGAGFKLGVEA